MSSYFSSCCILLNLLMHFLRWESADLWVCQLPGGTDGLPLGQAWLLQSFSFTSLGGEGEFIMLSLFWMCVYFTCVFLTSGNLFPQLVCVPPEWRLRIVIIVILNAVVSVLTEVRNPNGKNASLWSVSFFRVHVCLLFRRLLFTACQSEWLLFSR